MSRRTANTGHASPACAWALPAVLILAAAAAAAEVRVRTKVSPGEVTLGDAVHVEITAKGGRITRIEGIDAVPGFDVVVRGRRDEVRFGDSSSVWTLAATPQRLGTLTFPAVTVVAGGKDFRQKSFTVRVTEPPDAKHVRVELTADAERVYVGQPFHVTATADFLDPRRLRWGGAISLPFTEEPKRFHCKPLPPRPEDGEATPDRAGGRVVGHKRLKEDEQSIVRLTYRYAVSCLDTGRQSLGPAVVVVNEISVVKGRYGYRRRMRRVAARSGPCAVQVEPLPVEEQPPDFSGLIGDVQVRAEATPTTVNVGDPITLTVRVSGYPFFDRIELPDLVKAPGFAGAFRVPKDMADARTEDDAKVFTQTLRVARPDVKGIPSIGYVIFDPKVGRYRTAASQPIPLTVRPTRVARIDLGPRGSEAVVARELEDVAAGIAHNYEGLDALEDQRAGLADALDGAWTWAALIAPPALWAVSLGVSLLRHRERRDPGRRRRRHAVNTLRRVLRELPEGGDARADFARALRGFVADRLTLSAAGLTAADARSNLQRRGAASADAEALAALLDECDAGLYGGSDGRSLAAMKAEALELARRLDRGLKKGGA